MARSFFIISILLLCAIWSDGAPTQERDDEELQFADEHDAKKFAEFLNDIIDSDDEDDDEEEYDKIYLADDGDDDDGVIEDDDANSFEINSLSNDVDGEDYEDDVDDPDDSDDADNAEEDVNNDLYDVDVADDDTDDALFEDSDEYDGAIEKRAWGRSGGRSRSRGGWGGRRTSSSRRGWGGRRTSSSRRGWGGRRTSTSRRGWGGRRTSTSRRGWGGRRTSTSRRGWGRRLTSSLKKGWSKTKSSLKKGWGSVKKIGKKISFKKIPFKKIPRVGKVIDIVQKGYKVYKAVKTRSGIKNFLAKTKVTNTGKKGYTIRNSNMSYKQAEKMFNKSVEKVTTNKSTPQGHVKVGKTWNGETMTLRTKGNNGPTLDIKNQKGHVDKIRLTGN